MTPGQLVSYASGWLVESWDISVWFALVVLTCVALAALVLWADVWQGLE